MIFFLENDFIVKKLFFTEIVPLLNLKQIFKINDKKIFFMKDENLGNIFWGHNFYKNLNDKCPEFLNFFAISDDKIMPFDFFCNKTMNIKNGETEDFFINAEDKDNFKNFKNKLINAGKKNIDENENLYQLKNFFTYCDVFNSSFSDCGDHINKFYKDNNEYFFIKTKKYEYLFRFGNSCACIFKNIELNEAAVYITSINSTIYDNLCKNDFELFDRFQNLKKVPFLIEKYIIRDPDIINYFEFNEEELLKLMDFNPAIIRVLDKKHITKNICKKGILCNKDLEEYIIKTYGGNYSYEEIKSMLSIKPNIIRYLFGNNQNIFSNEHKKNVLTNKEILELKKFALSKNPSLIASLYYPDSELKDFVVEMDVNNIKYIRSPSAKLLLYCLEQNPNIFDDMEKDTFRDKIIAYDENILNLMIEKNVNYFFQKDTFRYVSFSKKNTLFFLEKIIENNIDFVNFLSFMSYAKIQLDDMQKIKDILKKSTNPQIISYADNIQDNSDFKF